MKVKIKLNWKYDGNGFTLEWWDIYIDWKKQELTKKEIINNKMFDIFTNILAVSLMLLILIGIATITKLLIGILF